MTSIGRYCLSRIADFLHSLRLGRAMVIMLSSLVHVIQPSSHVRETETRDVVTRVFERRMDQLLEEVRDLFKAPLNHERLHAMSCKLQDEFREKLQSSDICMLPSYQYTLPTGREQGTFLALDVGGSTLRVGLVELCGKTHNDDGMRIQRIKSYKIDKDIRNLQGLAFFDWMAERIHAMLGEARTMAQQDAAPISMGLAWSFPIQYVIKWRHTGS